jgi:hypothetical protein
MRDRPQRSSLAKPAISGDCSRRTTAYQDPFVLSAVPENLTIQYLLIEWISH